MNLNALVGFVNKNKVECQLREPLIGRVEDWHPVVRAKGLDHRLALVVGGAVISSGPVTVTADYVREVIEIDDQFRVSVGPQFPGQVIDFRKIGADAESALSQWGACHDFFDDWDGAAVQIENRLDAVQQPPESILKSHFKFIRWAEYSPDSSDIEPRGVLLIAPGGGLFVKTFPGYEEDGEKWKAIVSGKVDEKFLAGEIRQLVGRLTALSSVPETIKAESWDDAPMRALYRFGSEYYAKTGKTMFS